MATSPCWTCSSGPGNCYLLLVTRYLSFATLLPHSDVAVSVTESAEQARTFLTLLLAELYLQLTTISWLSVNSQVDRVLTAHCQQTLVSFYPPGAETLRPQQAGCRWQQLVGGGLGHAALLPLHLPLHLHQLHCRGGQQCSSHYLQNKLHYRQVWWRQCPGRRRGCGWRRRWP